MGAVKVLLTALGDTLQDGGMGTGTCQCNGKATGEAILCPLSSVTLQGKLCCCCTLDTFTPNYAAITAIYLAVMANIQLHCCMSL